MSKLKKNLVKSWCEKSGFITKCDYIFSSDWVMILNLPDEMRRSYLNAKSKSKIKSNFVAFSQKLNFTMYS